MSKRKPYNVDPGYVTSRRNTKVDHIVGQKGPGWVVMYDRMETDPEYDGPPRWLLVCTTHGTKVRERMKADGRAATATPEEWCDGCRKLEEHERLEEEVQRQRAEGFNPASLPVLPTDEVLTRYQGDDCPVDPATCMSCYDRLRDLGVDDLPRFRALCQDAHGWTSAGGWRFHPATDLAPPPQIV